MSAPPRSPAIPDRIGPYRIVEPLGEGGMGTVYRAANSQTGSEVALKTVRASREDELASLRREMHALARLEHPGIAQVVAWGEEGGVPWYAMQLVREQTLANLIVGLHGKTPGTPLAARAAGGQLDVVLRIVARLCATLAYLHGEGVVHRDLKPANVLVRDGGWPVLVDFGLVVTTAERSGREFLERGTTHISGTVDYMPPEQIVGDLVDTRADLYSLGCVLYEVLTGRPPYVGTNPVEVLNAHLAGGAPPPSQLVEGIPPKLDAIVERLLARQPAERFGYAEDVAGAFADLGAVGAVPEDWPTPRDHLFRPAFCGRAAELASLRDHLATAGRGSGALVLVAGESGVGKTRFATEVIRQAERQGFTILHGGCHPSDSASEPAAAAESDALAPFRSPLQAISDRCLSGGRAVTAALLGARAPILAPYLPGLRSLPGVEQLPRPVALPVEAARLRLFSALRETLAAVASDRPVLLVLDDLQWADDLSLAFLAHLVRHQQLASCALVVVGTCRSDETRAEVDALAGSGAAVVSLPRLGADSVESIVTTMLARPAPKALTAYVRRHSEGVPFYIAEYLRASVAEGLLYRDDEGAWRLGGDAEAALDQLATPGSLLALVERRLQGLPPDCQELVGTAAVLGRELSGALLEGIASLPADRFLESLSELLQRQILVERAAGHYRFDHDKIREAAYGRIASDETQRLHRTVAMALAGRAASDTPPHAELAFHWERAGEPGRARAHYRLAAERAHSTYALGETGRLLSRFLDLSEEPTHETVSARHELAIVLGITWKLAGAEEVLHRGIAESRQLGLAAEEVDLQAVLADVLIRANRLEDAADAIDAASRLARTIDDPHRLGRALARKGSLESVRGTPEEALRLGLEALDCIEGDEDIAFRTRVLSTLCVSYRDLGRFDEGRQAGEQAVALARRLSDPVALGVALARLGFLLRQQGKLREAMLCCDEAVPVLSGAGEIFWEGVAIGVQAAIERDAGLLRAAEEHYRAAISRLRDAGEQYWIEVCRGGAAQAAADLGRLGEAAESLERVVARLEERGEHHWRGVQLGSLAAIRQAQGRSDEACRLYQESLAVARELGNRAGEAEALLGLARVAHRGGDDPARAKPLLAKAEALYRTQGNDLGLAFCLVEEGLFSADAARANELLDGASDLADRVGVTTASELGRCLDELRAKVAAPGSGGA